ncbi:MAG: fibronectin type III domain-containing protein [Thermodesulfobacteriota bacterium]
MSQRKRLKGWLPAIAFVLLMFALAGCGGGGGGESSGSSGLPPAPPSGVTVTAGTAQAIVSWPAVAGATSYNIYYSTTAGQETTSNGTKVANATSPKVINGLTNGTTYYFIVTAVDASGESSASSEVSATPLASPSGIQVTAGDGQVTVGWTAAAGATSYNIYYSTAAGQETTASGVKFPNATSPQVITGLTNGTRYYFVVTAVNASGESTTSSEVSAIPPGVPAQPSGVTATATTGQATVSWNAVTFATSYNVYYSDTSGVTKSHYSNSVPNATSPQVITGLIDGITYYFIVTAVDASGESAESSEVSATPLARPSGIQVTAGDGQVTVSWTAAAGATSYNIYYSTTAGQETTASGVKFPNAVSPQVITNLTNGSTYYFVVTAVNNSGESIVSSEKSATPSAAPQPPASPTGVKVTSPATGQMHVTWNAVVGATSYNVYYLQATSPPTNADVLATTPANTIATSLDVNGLTSGATYYVLVTAVNGAGESGTQTSPKAITIL